MAKTFQIEVEVPHGLKAGDRFAVTVEAPATPKVRKTKIANIPVEQMTMEQLKKELVNARSVLYKATRRDDPVAIANATKRVNNVAREIASRKGTTLYEEVNAPLGLFEDENASA